MLLSEALPEYHFRERHQRSVTLAETPIARTLMRLRRERLPAIARRAAG